MAFPRFIDIEVVELDEQSIPAVIAWSLPDGSIKSAIIEPDEDWLQNSAGERFASLDHLFEEGLPLREIVREMQQDLGEDTLYTDGLHDDEMLLTMIFEAVGKDLPYEVFPISELLSDSSPDDVEKVWRMLLAQEGLSLESATDCVYSLLLLAREFDALRDSNEADDEDEDDEVE